MTVGNTRKTGLAILLIGIFAAAGATLALFALPAQATDRSVDISVRCNGIWTGSLEWTLNGDDIGPAVDLSCPDVLGKRNFRLNVTVPVTGAAHANDFQIDVESATTTNSGLPLGDCEFSRDFNPDNLSTVKSTLSCANDGPKGEKLSHRTSVR